jgi:hypothetical protein
MECVKIWAGFEPCLGGKRASKVSRKVYSLLPPSKSSSTVQNRSRAAEPREENFTSAPGTFVG